MSQEKKQQPQPPRPAVGLGRGGGAVSLQPTTYEQLIEFCRVVAASEMIPEAFRDRPGDVMVAVQMGAEVGLKAMQALQNIAVINNRPCIWGDAVPAIVEASGKMEYMKEWHEDSSDPKKDRACCEVKREGREPQIRYFSKQDAKDAGLLGKKGPWTTYPRRMMQMRARSWALRDVFSDVLKGFSVAEEQQDVEMMRNVTGEAKATVAERITDTQADDLRVLLADAKLTEEELCEAAGIDSLEMLSAQSVKRATNWIANNARQQEAGEEPMDAEVVDEQQEQ